MKLRICCKGGETGAWKLQVPSGAILWVTQADVCVAKAAT